MALLTAPFQNGPQGGAFNDVAQLASIFQRQQQQAQQQLDQTAREATRQEEAKQRAQQAVLDAAMLELRRAAEFKQKREFDNTKLAIDVRDSNRDYDLKNRDMKIREDANEPFSFTTPAASSIPAPAETGGFGATASAGIDFGTSPASSGMKASSGSVFGMVPDGSGGWMHDPNDITDASVPGFSATKGAWGAPIKDPSLKGVALRPDELKAAGVPISDPSGHEVEVMKDGKTFRYPIVDKLGKSGRIDFTASAYEELGGPMNKGGGLIDGINYRIVPKDAPKVEQSAGKMVSDTLRDMQAAGIPISKGAVRAALPGMLSAAVSAQGRAAIKAATPGSEAQATAAAIASWPVNENNERFNPENPDERYKVSISGKGYRVEPVKPENSGLTPVGENLWEDGTGAQFFKNKIDARGRAEFRRVEEDQEVKARVTDANTGRQVLFNKFGKEIGVTDERFNFLKSNSKPMIGTDGNVYVMTMKPEGGYETVPPVPDGVKFDGGKSRDVGTARVGNDGKVYGFRRDGSPITPLPEGVRFDRPKDPDAAAKWEVDQKTGNLSAFNYKGEKIAENEGDFARISAKANERLKGADKTTLQMYQQIAPPVKALWSVLDQIKKAGASPADTHQALVEKLGETGRALSTARGNAQKMVESIQIGPRGSQSRIGIDFAENWVRDFEGKFDQTGERKGTFTAEDAKLNAPAAPAMEFASAEDVKAAVKAGKLERGAALEILRSKFGLR